MLNTHQQTLPRKERIKGLKAAEQLFNSKSTRSVMAFPLRAVYLVKEREEEGEATVRMMVSAPKRLLKHAVWRNRVKRQIREAYRLNKQLLSVPEGKTMLVGFIWTDAKLYDSKTVADRMKKLLVRMGGHD